MIINYTNQADKIETTKHSMDAEQATIYMDVISEALKINSKSDFFNWSQGIFQSLLAHDILIYGVKSSDSDFFNFDYYTASRYFGASQFAKVTKYGEGLSGLLLQEWKNTGKLILDKHIAEGRPHNCVLMDTTQEALRELEMKNYVAYGYEDRQSSVTTFCIFSRLKKPFDDRAAKMLNMLVSHLHIAILNVTSEVDKAQPQLQRAAKRVTLREVEVLQWVYAGKTNWEIASILEVSPLTIKNHVQNILRKLDVQNRRQAALKAAKMGLVKS